ncbi:CBS domain-containing protein [Alicyclobacillaceae bacterium I2511]|nr:CBS domain-containing protein [Alicyclobacillaceae bacterium I2511]
MARLGLQDMLNTPLQNLMIAAERVACVYAENSLEHALLVLIKSGYSSVPVLSHQEEVTGTVSKTMILDSILGIERIEFEQLDQRQVQDVMNREVPRIQVGQDWLTALEMSIHQPYLCVEDEQDKFLGILTRSKLLSQIHGYFRSMSVSKQGDGR